MSKIPKRQNSTKPKIWEGSRSQRLRLAIQLRQNLLTWLLCLSKLVQHYRRTYCHFHRYLFLRQCFYFSFSLSCFGALLLGAWLFIVAQEWQQRLQRELPNVFLILEEQYGIHVRFHFQGLYLLHQIQLSDIQVGLNIPGTRIEKTESKVSNIAPLRQISSMPTIASSQNLRLSNPSTAKLTQLANDALANHSGKHIYVQIDKLRLTFRLLPLLQNAWQLLHSTEANRESNTASGNPSSSQVSSWQPHLKLLPMLQNIKKLSLGRVDLDIYTSKPNNSTKNSQTESRREKFIWQDILRVFPIEIHSLQLDFDFWQQTFEGENIRFLLQSSTTSKQTHPRIESKAFDNRLQNLWYHFLALLPGHLQASQPKQTTHPEIQRNGFLPNYLFDLKGKFRSNLTNSTTVNLWGQIHARGGLSHNFSQAYLIMELQEWHSNYGSFRPIEFQMEYQAQNIKLQALSKIRTLDWQLKYSFGAQTIDVKLWADDFQLQDYLDLNPSSDNPLLAWAPLLEARLSGESQIQILLPRAQHPLDLRYQTQLRALLSQMSVTFDGEGDLNSLKVRNAVISQRNWQAQFRGDLAYQTLLPDGLLNFRWDGSQAGYRGRFLLQRSGNDQLLIDTLQSQFSGLGLPDSSLLPLLELQTLPIFQNPATSQDLLQTARPEIQLLEGLPPWAQPQLRSLVLYRQGNYHISAQFRILLSQKQMPESPNRLQLDPYFHKAPTLSMRNEKLNEATFYLLPILGLTSSVQQRSNITWELNTLEWDQNTQHLKNGQVPLSALLGSDLPAPLEFLLPGLSHSYLKLSSSLFNNGKSFQLWLKELQIQGPNKQKNLLLQGTANPGQINLEKLQLRWDNLKIDNRFLWDISEQSGTGQLELQEQSLHYSLKQILLPSTQSYRHATLPPEKPRTLQQRGWLLRGDYELYAYFDLLRYQVAFQQVPLPQLPSFKRFQQVKGLPTSNSLLSLAVSGHYAQQTHWQIDVSQFRLEIPQENPYLPQSAELRFVGFLRPDEFNFQQLALLEPQRLLQGRGSLRFIRPLTPILPEAQPYSSLPPKLPQRSVSPHSTFQAKSTMQQAKPSALPLSETWIQSSSPSTKPQKSGYWLGDFRLHGALTEAGLRQGESQVKGGENLQISLNTEGQQFHIKGDGQLDATRFTQLLDLLQGEQRSGLQRGTLKFSAEAQGLFNRLENLGKIVFQKLQGQWQLAQASYAGHDLEIGSQVLWNPNSKVGEAQAHNGKPGNEIEGNAKNEEPTKSQTNSGTEAWLFSDIQGQFGQILVEHSFLSFQNQGSQKLVGLLNYAIQLSQESYYRSSLALNLERRTVYDLNQSKYENMRDIEAQELLRWRGSLYSYPMRAYSSSQELKQSKGSFAAIAQNLHNNVFSGSNESTPKSIRSIYPGFDIFLESRIVSTEQGTRTPELHLFRRRPEDLEMGIQSRKFWLNVGTAYPISFRARGSHNGENIDAQIEQLLVEPQLLNVLMPYDAIMQNPIIQFEQGQISGSIRIYGNILAPAIDGSLQLQKIRLRSPYFPGNSPTLNIELVAEGHIIMAKPFQVQFRDGLLYSDGYEEAYLRHQAFQITRYYLGLHAEGKAGIPIFYDAYGIEYTANAKGSAILEGNDQSGYLNANFEFNHLLMQGSQRRKATENTSSNGTAGYSFSLNIRAKVGRSARLAYPQEASSIFSTRLNPRNELQISYDGNTRQGSLEGRITLYNGELYLLGNQMALRKGELVFDETFDHFSPKINLLFSLYTYDQQGQNIQINMDYQGDLSSLTQQNWSPTLSSQPPLPEQQLRYLVAAQLNSGGATSTNDPTLQQSLFVSGLLSQLGSSVVLKPIEGLIRKEFKLGEVNFKTDLLDNLLNDYLGINYRLLGAVNGTNLGGAAKLDHSVDSAYFNWIKYLDNTHMSFGMYLDRNNTILLSINIDLLYKPQDTEPVSFSRNGLQIVPGLGVKFRTPLLDITWDIGFAHYNDYFITDSSLLLEWSLSEFLNRRNWGTLEHSEENVYDEMVLYREE